jgi:serine-type D-Ala-D-Ala carboxypeptidase/endopeptidase (penicillin-binding protein 4)
MSKRRATRSSLRPRMVTSFGAMLLGVAGAVAFAAPTSQPESIIRWPILVPASDEPVADPSSPSRTKVAAAIRSRLGNPSLGTNVQVVIVDPATGDVLFRQGAGPATPASTLKLLTVSAALRSVGGDTRFRTKTLWQPETNTLTLVGGGDPYLSDRRATNSENSDLALPPPPRSGRLDQLAQDTVTVLRAQGVTSVKLRYDTSLFSGPSVAPSWPASYISENVVAPIEALWVNRGRKADNFTVESDPAQAAADRFADLLSGQNLAVTGSAEKTLGSGQGRELAATESAPVRQMARHILEVSDNEGAEVLARQIALAEGKTGSFEEAAATIEQLTKEEVALTQIPTSGLTSGPTFGRGANGVSLADGSGLSRSNQVDPIWLAGVLAAANADPTMADLWLGLPVGGLTGSLADRFEGSPAAGLVRAKTGTLTGVSAIAGTVTTKSGYQVVAVIVADQVAEADTEQARSGLDAILEALTVT